MFFALLRNPAPHCNVAHPFNVARTSASGASKSAQTLVILRLRRMRPNAQVQYGATGRSGRQAAMRRIAQGVIGGETHTSRKLTEVRANALHTTQD